MNQGWGQYPQQGYPQQYQPIVAKRERKSEVAGAGCLVQGVGLLLPVAGFFIWFVPGALLFGLIGLLLLVVGGRMALKYVCGNCKNPLADKAVRMCPTCRAELR